MKIFLQLNRIQYQYKTQCAKYQEGVADMSNWIFSVSQSQMT